MLAARHDGHERGAVQTVHQPQEAGVRSEVDGDSRTFEVRLDDAHREARLQFGLQDYRQISVGAPKRHRPRPEDADHGDRRLRGGTGRPRVHSGPGPRPRDARLHEIPVRGGYRVPMQPQQLLRAAHAWESAAGLDLAAEDAGLQVADELSAE